MLGSWMFTRNRWDGTISVLHIRVYSLIRSSTWHYYDSYPPSCDVGLCRSCVHSVIKCFVESLFFVISCIFPQGVELNVSKICNKCVPLVFLENEQSLRFSGTTFVNLFISFITGEHCMSFSFISCWIFLVFLGKCNVVSYSN